MALDTEQLYLDPELARALGYDPPPLARPQPHPAQVAAPQYYANQPREEGGFIPALLMLFGAGFVLLLLLVGGIALLGHLAEERMAANTEPPRSTEPVQNQDLPRRIIETRTTENAAIPAPDVSSISPQYAVSLPIQQPQEPQQIVETPESPAPVTDADAIEGPLYTEESNQGLLSWRWVCSAPQGQNPRCSLRDPNGNYLQTFEFDGHGLVTSEFSPRALRPRSWGCERTVDEKLYCTIQDGRGTILQGCTYDGKILGCGTEPGSSPVISTASEQESEPPEYLPSEYDIGCLKNIPFGWMLVYEHIPHGYADGHIDRMPEGTYLLYERANINGYRRVVSLDGQYAGYAQMWPSAGNMQEPKHMEPGYAELIARLRQIP